MQRSMIIGYMDSAEGRDALSLGAVLAGTLGLRPIVASVMPWSNLLLSKPDLDAALRSETEESFALAREELSGLDLETRALANHSAAEALYELAIAERALLVVVGSAHRGRLGRILLGSVGQSLLQGAPCAVCVAPRGYAERPERRMLKLAVAFDGSPEAWVAYETAVHLAERQHATLTVLTVAQPEHYTYASSAAVLTPAEFHNFELDEKKRILDLALGRAPASLPIEGRMLSGSPGATLAEASSEFDLMVVGSRGYGPLKRTALGSVGNKLVASAAAPVLALPRGAGMDPLELATAEAAGAPGATAGD
jgi:nucleotide-binding universal stress UspA family protein